jgi:trehalose 6-phosphate phosphatase
LAKAELVDNTMQRGVEPRDNLRAIPSPESIDVTRTALLLDVDGTLLDIASTPEGVVVPAALAPTLRHLLTRTGGAVALVSGRTIATLDRLFAPLTLPAIGGHGAEMRLSGGDPVAKRRPAPLSQKLRRKLHALAGIDPRLLVEDKLHSVALHYRLALQREDFLKQEVASIVAADHASEVESLFGKAVIEVKPKHYNKGTAVTELMTCEPFAGRTPLFIGDDTTDEAVFAILPDLAGYGFSVGREMAGADGVFESPHAVRAWLSGLAGQAEPAA